LCSCFWLRKEIYSIFRHPAQKKSENFIFFHFFLKTAKFRCFRRFGENKSPAPAGEKPQFEGSGEGKLAKFQP